MVRHYAHTEQLCYGFKLHLQAYRWWMRAERNLLFQKHLTTFTGWEKLSFSLSSLQCFNASECDVILNLEPHYKHYLNKFCVVRHTLWILRMLIHSFDNLLSRPTRPPFHLLNPISLRLLISITKEDQIKTSHHIDTLLKQKCINEIFCDLAARNLTEGTPSVILSKVQEHPTINHPVLHQFIEL